MGAEDSLPQRKWLLPEWSLLVSSIEFLATEIPSCHTAPWGHRGTSALPFETSGTSSAALHLISAPFYLSKLEGGHLHPDPLPFKAAPTSPHGAWSVRSSSGVTFTDCAPAGVCFGCTNGRGGGPQCVFPRRQGSSGAPSPPPPPFPSAPVPGNADAEGPAISSCHSRITSDARVHTRGVPLCALSWCPHRQQGPRRSKFFCPRGAPMPGCAAQEVPGEAAHCGRHQDEEAAGLQRRAGGFGGGRGPAMMRGVRDQ